MSRSYTTEDDRQWREIVEQIPALDGATVDVGVQSDAGAGSDGTPIVEYAFFNEFGTSNIPERPFLRGAHDENARKWSGVANRAVDSVIGLRSSPQRALSILGELAQKDVKAKIISLRTPPNAASTVDRKGSSNPLFDTGDMHGTIRYAVRLGK